MNIFRTLRADEIDCRVSLVKADGLSLLLYKDARCDQNVLDETVGAMNWQRSHTRDNANCIVSLWDDEKWQWVSKEDTGTESNTEKEKGLASDSFKRACFNWGIGRELYSAPFIWIPNDLCNIKNENGRYKCNDRFTVDEIQYQAEGNRDICALRIKNQRNGCIVFDWTDMAAKPQQQETMPQNAPECPSQPAGAQAGKYTPVEPGAVRTAKTAAKTTVEKVDVNRRVFILKNWANTYHIPMQKVGDYIQSLHQGGAIPTTEWRTMPEADFSNLLHALDANYGGDPA